ncbi:MAG: hypothetical protein ABI651_02725 [Verrucomicrobiota bacterium]
MNIKNKNILQGALDLSTSHCSAVLAGAMFVVVGHFSQASAQSIILQYNIATANSGTSSTVAANGVDANVKADALGVSFASPNNPPNLAGQFSWKNWGSSSNGDVRQDSIFYQFTVTPNTGFQITYNTLTFAVFANGIGANKWQLWGSTDGFLNNPGGANTFSLMPERVLTTAGEQDVFSPSLAALGTQSGAVTFRLYGYSDSSGGVNSAGLANGAIGLTGSGSNVLLNGTVQNGTVNGAVPEPSACAAVVGVAALGFAALNRRARKV